MFCEWKSTAAKRYQSTVMIDMMAYIFIIFGVQVFVRHHHPGGAELYALAALPTFPIIGLLVAVGIYLRDEHDEYQRNVMVKCMLWGTAGILALTSFLGFLHSFGWTGEISPFTEFVTFWLLVAVAKVFYKLTNRVPKDE